MTLNIVSTDQNISDSREKDLVAQRNKVGGLTMGLEDPQPGLAFSSKDQQHFELWGKA